MNAISKLTSDLAKKQRELSELESEIQQTRDVLLRGLPEKLGFASIDAMIVSLASLASAPLRAAIRNAVEVTTRQRRSRAVINDALRAEIADTLKEGKLNAQQVSEKFGVSVSAVNVIKKAARLTRKKTPRERSRSAILAV